MKKRREMPTDYGISIVRVMEIKIEIAKSMHKYT